MGNFAGKSNSISSYLFVFYCALDLFAFLLCLGTRGVVCSSEGEPAEQGTTCAGAADVVVFVAQSQTE